MSRWTEHSEHLFNLSVTIAFSRFGQNILIDTPYASSCQRTLYKFLVDLMNLFQLRGLCIFELYKIYLFLYFEFYRDNGENNIPAQNISGTSCIFNLKFYPVLHKAYSRILRLFLSVTFLCGQVQFRLARQTSFPFPSNIPPKRGGVM